MDFVKRTICLEDARTRTEGLMPYYEFGTDNNSLVIASGYNGNWGNFVANPSFLSSRGKTYNTMLYNYYALLNMVREGVKLRKVETKDGDIIFTEDVGSFYLAGECFSGGTEPASLYTYAAYDATLFHSIEIESLRDETRHIYKTNEDIADQFIVLISDYDKFQFLSSYLDDVDYHEVSSQRLNGGKTKKWSQYCTIVDSCIGKLEVPAKIYNNHLKVPKTLNLADVKEYIEWLTNFKPLSADCCNEKLYEERGGDEMLQFLRANESKYNDTLRKLSNISYSVPFVELQLSLTQNLTDVGVLTNIDGAEYVDGQKRPHHDGGMPTGFTIDDIHMGQKRMRLPVSGDGAVEVESQLLTLRSRKKYLDDKNNVLPGLFKSFPSQEGAMFACVKSSDEKYYRLTLESYSGTYRLVYVLDDSLSEGDISIPKAANTYETEINKVYGVYATQAEAQAALNAEMSKYNSTNNAYIVCEKIPAWEMKPLSEKPKDCINGDGQVSKAVLYGRNGEQSDGQNWQTAAGKYYRTITTESAGIRIAMTREEEDQQLDELNAHYFFMVKYDNSATSPMTIPYKVGNTANVYAVNSGNPRNTLYRGDFILSVIQADSYVEITYVIGGYFNGTTSGKYVSYNSGGDIYYEKRTLDKCHVDYVPLDGVDNVPVWSEYVDFDSDAKEFYSPRYNLYRTGVTANIIEMTTGEYWNKDWAYDAYLTKEDYLINFSSPPKVDVNVTVDRGGASAFERHYKLSECNTMEDLERYHNGEFFENEY